MLFSIEQAFVGREEIRALQKMPAWEATPPQPGIYRVPPPPPFFYVVFSLGKSQTKA